MRTFFLLSLLLIIIHAGAQLPDYYVYAVKGEPTWMKPNTKPQKLTQKQLLYRNDVVALPKSAGVTLVNKDGQYLNLVTTGQYRINELIKQLHTTSTGLTRKYFTLLWNELLNPGSDLKALKKEQATNKWGGISRGSECANLIYPVNGLKTAEDDVRLVWRQTSPAGSYALLLYDNTGKEVLNKAVKDTQAVVAMADVLPGKTGTLYWMVKGEGATCEDDTPVRFDRISTNEEQQFLQTLRVNDPDSVEEQLERIGKLEKAGLIPAAQKQFSELVSSHKEDPALAKSYVWFLLQYGMEDKATAVWDAYVAGRN